MLSLNNLVLSVEKLHLMPDVDIEMQYGKVSVSFYWHRPSVNVGWYPIAEIHVYDDCKYHREGSENSWVWDKLAQDVAKKLKEMEEQSK